MDPDLRRRTRREAAALLAERAVWLPPEERALVEAVFRDGSSVAAYVRACRERGESSSARSARRQLRRLIARLTSPRFEFVLSHRQRWGTTRRRVAMACVVQGRSLRDAACGLGLTLHAVRRHMDVVDGLFSAAACVGAAGDHGADA